jgi:hypothetical protein
MHSVVSSDKACSVYAHMLRNRFTLGSKLSLINLIKYSFITGVHLNILDMLKMHPVLRCVMLLLCRWFQKYLLQLITTLVSKFNSC